MLYKSERNHWRLFVEKSVIRELYEAKLINFLFSFANTWEIFSVLL